MATSKGADVQEALKSLRKTEEKVRSRYNQAMQNLRQSPKDVREGLDFADDMLTDLTIVQGYRQQLERYALTLDPTEIMNTTGDAMPVRGEE